MKKYMNYGGRSFAAGGAMPMEQLTEFNEGGRHEENGLGGIPQGMNPEGQMNLVEEGETKFDAENYIYSDSLKIDKELADAFNLDPKMVGKTFADASKIAGRKKSKREGDAIEEAANNADLENLMEAQEAFKQARIEEKLQEIAELDPNALPALMGQGQDPNMMQDPAMGGQMQEAPMDEQAMMEQQMMAEQQGGGGQPSPEEMAMMQQQQDMAMGQQEGMMRNGGYTRSYAPGGFMGANPGMMNMANANMMNPGPCGTPGNPPCPGKETEFTTSKIDRMGNQSNQNQSSTIGGLKFSPNLSFTEEAGFADDRVMQELRQSMLSQYGAAATDSDPAYGTGVGTTLIENTPPVKSNDFNVPQTTSNSNLNPPSTGSSPVIRPRHRHTGFNKIVQGIAHPFNKDKRIQASFKSMPFMLKEGEEGGLVARGIAPRGLRRTGGNLMQPMNQMRRGGKMCYGCGGAMHAYGGRMNGMNQMATGGEIAAGVGSAALGTLKVFGSLDPTGTVNTGIDTLHDFAQEKAGLVDPNDPGQDTAYNVGSIIGNVASIPLSGGASAKTAAGDLSSQTGDLLDNVGEMTGNEDLQKAGKVVEGAGRVASMFMGDAGSAASSAGSVAAGAGAGTLGAGAKAASAADAATKASKAAKFAKVGEIASNKAVQAGLNVGTQALENSTAKAEAERLAEEERMRVEREMMMTNDPTSLYYNSTTELPPLTLGQGGYMGTRSYGKGGGLWANIHAKRKRIAAGSNERMRKPGSKGAPTAEALKNSQNALGGRLYYPGGFLETKPELETNPETDEFNNMYPDISEALKQTPLQQAALYAPIAKNLYDATLAKSDDYTPDFVPAEFVQLDSAQAIQQAKQSNAGIVNAAKAKGFNNPSVMLALNQQLQGNVANVQAQFDQVNAKFKQAKLDKDNVQKRELSKIKEELAMRLKEAKNAAANEALIQAKGIAENKTANKLAALYATMGAPDMGKNFMGNKKMTKAQLDKAIKKLEEERKKL